LPISLKLWPELEHVETVQVAAITGKLTELFTMSYNLALARRRRSGLIMVSTKKIADLTD